MADAKPTTCCGACVWFDSESALAVWGLPDSLWVWNRESVPVFLKLGQFCPECGAHLLSTGDIEPRPDCNQCPGMGLMISHGMAGPVKYTPLMPHTEEQKEEIRARGWEFVQPEPAPTGDIEARGEGLREELREAASDYWVQKALGLEAELARRGEVVGEALVVLTGYSPTTIATNFYNIQWNDKMREQGREFRVLLVRAEEREP